MAIQELEREKTGVVVAIAVIEGQPFNRNFELSTASHKRRFGFHRQVSSVLAANYDSRYFGFFSLKEADQHGIVVSSLPHYSVSSEELREFMEEFRQKGMSYRRAVYDSSTIRHQTDNVTAEQRDEYRQEKLKLGGFFSKPEQDRARRKR